MEKQFDDPFAEIGTKDLSVGVELFNALNIGVAKLRDPIGMEKIKVISNFLNEDIDPIFTIQHVVRSNKNPEISNLDHLFQFVRLTETKRKVEQEVETLNKELKHFD